MPRYLGLIPAAGSGVRLGNAAPKQYLPLAGRTMLEHAIEALRSDRRVERVLVVVAAGDTRWQELALPPAVEFAASGGATRAESVRNGVDALATMARSDDWVLVHDAARPCLSTAEVSRLIDTLGDDEVGGLLALPLSDTLKEERADGDGIARVARTVARERLWRALTPQMFRLGVLSRAFAALGAGTDPTDEAMVVEHAGLRPRLVPGAATNVKVTHAADWALAEAILGARTATRAVDGDRRRGDDER